ncbi:MAG: hypothetical protein DSY37_03050 [Hyperthermus sp.]|nr:MAG: hypothetical protein DSY37_03050 [Hyperthermus sp.]
MLCDMLEPRSVVVTDIDGTLIDESYVLSPRARYISALLQAANVPLVLATSKTREEAWIYARRLGLSPECPGYVLIVEEGAVVEASTPRLLPEGRIELAKPLRPSEALDLVPGRCKSRVLPIQHLAPGVISSLTGLPYYEADAAKRRSYTVALHGPRDCLEEAREKALSLGLYARLGRHFLIVGRIRGKHYALRVLLERSPLLHSATTISLGDSGMDALMLEESDTAIVVPKPDGAWLRLRKPYYHVAMAPAPEGWVDALGALLGNIIGFVRWVEDEAEPLAYTL